MDEKKIPPIKQNKDFTSTPKTVAEFRIHPQLPERHQQLIEEYNTCVLCGSELIFTHVTNFMELTVEEESYCTCCNIRNTKEHHRLN